MDYQNILIEKKERIGLLTINREKVRNALSPETWAEIREAMDDFSNDDQVGVVIITGAGGKSFAAGADISTLKQRKMKDILKNKAPGILNEIENLDKPVIAAIAGFALGGGCELAMACDIRIATSDSRFGLPEVSLGVIPGAGGTQRLQRLVGFGKAKELILTGEILNAQEALAIGLINKVVAPEENLMETANKMANKIMEKGPLAVAMAKLAVNTGASTDLTSGLTLEKLAQTVLFATEDHLEGIAAFLEKRKADFKGK